MLVAILLLFGYLAGAVPTGLLIARRLGAPDPRTVGSGNIGATNLARVAGWRAALVTLLGDATKGALPTGLALALGVGAEEAALVAAAAVVGHCLPVTLDFVGGKGVATAAGGFAVVAPPEIASAMLQRQQASAIVSARETIVEGAVGMVETALSELRTRDIVVVGLLLTRTSALGSLAACATLLLALILSGAPSGVSLAGGGVVALIVARHGDNIRRLLGRRDSKVRP